MIPPTSPIPPFELERYFARHEFVTEYLLCSSDVEGMSLREVLALADDEMRERWNALTLGYTESPGHPLLRRAVAALYETLQPEDVIVTNSGEEPIYITMRLLLRAGDHAIVTWPGYQSHYEIARSIGAEVTLLPLRPQTEHGRTRWMIDLDELRTAVRPNTRMLLTSFPHNPTGALPTHDEWRAIAALVDAAGLRWVSDEVYRGLEFLPGTRLATAADLNARALSIGAMSKTYAMAGARIGWAATRDAQLREQILTYKDYTTICSSAPSEILSTIALRASDAVIARSRTIIDANLAHAARFFAAHRERFDYIPPAAGSVAFPRLRHDDADEFAAALLREQNTLLLPASAFGYAQPHFRMGFGRPNFPQALQRLETFIAAESSAAAK
jgi:aspartate/methionine/tyrosine aminotransferase